MTRVFLAFWPDAPVLGALEAARHRLFPLAGRAVEATDLHLTAAFLGAVEPARLDALRGLCGPVAAGVVKLDHAEHWPKSALLVAAASQTPPALTRCIDDLWRRLDRLGFARETRPFRPHVTLACDVQSMRATLKWTTVEWPLSRVGLFQSVPGGNATRYRDISGRDISGRDISG
jgi:2'-5' RNA ligase